MDSAKGPSDLIVKALQYLEFMASALECLGCVVAQSCPYFETLASVASEDCNDFCTLCSQIFAFSAKLILHLLCV